MTTDNRENQEHQNHRDERSSTSIQPIPLTEELKKPCLDYAMSVIVSRALPNVICNNNAYMKNDIHNLIYTGNNS